MKAKPFPGLPPVVKGVPTREVLDLWNRGPSHGHIQRRFPALTWADIDWIVNAYRYGPIESGLAARKTITQLAKGLRMSPAAIFSAKRKAERNAFHKKEWGGLSPRAVTFLKRLGYKNFLELQRDPPSEEKLFCTKGAGIYLFNEIRNAVPLKRGEHPVEVVRRSPALPPPEPRPPAPSHGSPPFYVTKASHTREVLESPTAPEPAKQFARFLDAIVKFAKAAVPADELLPSDIPCMAGPSPRRWCLGVVDIFWSVNPLGVRWECPLCHKQGIVTDVGFAPAPTAPREPGERLH